MLLAAAVLLLVLALVHSVLGEALLFRRWTDYSGPVVRDAAFTFGTLRATWHAPSAFALGMAGALARLEVAGAAGVLDAFAASFALAAVLVAGLTRGRHPAWAVLLAIGGLCVAAR